IEPASQSDDADSLVVDAELMQPLADGLPIVAARASVVGDPGGTGVDAGPKLPGGHLTLQGKDTGNFLGVLAKLGQIGSRRLASIVIDRGGEANKSEEVFSRHGRAHGAPASVALGEREHGIGPASIPNFTRQLEAPCSGCRAARRRAL